MSEISPNLPEANVPDTENDQNSHSLLSNLLRRKALIFAILIATGSAAGCDTCSCNFAGCNIVKVQKGPNNNVEVSGCSGCSSCGTEDNE